MPKKRASADKKAVCDDGDGMYNLPLVPQQAAIQAPLSKKKKSQQILPAPESDSDEVEPATGNVDNDSDGRSEDNESNDDALPAPESGSSSKSNVHDKRCVCPQRVLPQLKCTYTY
jgi:hypothetical protein